MTLRSPPKPEPVPVPVPVPASSRGIRILSALCLLFASLDLLLSLLALLSTLRSHSSLSTGLPSSLPTPAPGLPEALASAEHSLAPLFVPRLLLGFAMPAALLLVALALRAHRLWWRRAALAWCLAAFATIAYQCFAAFYGASLLVRSLGRFLADPSLPASLQPSAEITGLYLWLATHAAFPIILLLIALRKPPPPA